MLFRLDAGRAIACRNGQPGCVGGTKTRVLRIIPLHRSAFSVAAFLQRPARDANGILHVLYACRWSSDHSYLLAVVHQRGRTRGKQKGSNEFSDGLVMHAITVTVPTTDVVMIVEDEERLIAADLCLRIADSLTKKVGVELISEAYLHVHGKLELVVLCSAVPLVEFLYVWQVGLTDQHTIARVLISQGAKTAHDIVHLWQVVVHVMLLLAIAIGVGAFYLLGIAKSWIFEERGDCVEPETCYASVEPETDGVEHGFFYGRIAPV